MVVSDTTGSDPFMSVHPFVSVLPADVAAGLRYPAAAMGAVNR